jgi:hypothetical protein
LLAGSLPLFAEFGCGCTTGGAGNGCTVAIWLGNMQKDDQKPYMEIGEI